MAKERLNDVLADVQAELKRFEAKLASHIERQNKEGNQSWCIPTKEAGALRRSALDLKNELTRITTSEN